MLNQNLPVLGARASNQFTSASVGRSARIGRQKGFVRLNACFLRFGPGGVTSQPGRTRGSLRGKGRATDRHLEGPIDPAANYSLISDDETRIGTRSTD